MTFSHNMASVNGIQMHYVIGGHGPPVVLLHGWPETWYEFRLIMPALAKNYTVIAPDLRGLGDSSKPTTGYDGKTVAEDIHQLVSLSLSMIFIWGCWEQSAIQTQIQTQTQLIVVQVLVQQQIIQTILLIQHHQIRPNRSQPVQLQSRVLRLVQVLT